MNGEISSDGPGLRQAAATRTDLMLALLVAGAVGAAGVAPHLAYALSAGDVAYFKSAADEEYYAMFSAYLLAPDEVSFWRRSYLFFILYKLTGGALPFALILSDAIFPFVTFFAAYWLARLFFSARGAIAGALCLLFGQELLSLGSLAVFKNFGLFSLPGIRAHLPEWALPLLPDYTTYYFGLYRTPEPQISWAGTFVALRLLLSGWLDIEGASARKAKIVGAHAILPFLYSYCMIGVLVLSACLAGISLLKRDYPTFRSILLGLLCTAAGFGIVASASIYFVGSQLTLLFPSRLPALSASQVYSLLLLALLMWLRAKRRLENGPFFLAIAAAAVPIVVMNYQVLVGVMISARDWERNINFVPVVIAGFVVTRSLAQGWSADRRQRVAMGLVVVMLGVLAMGQRNVWGMFLHYNEVATAARRALSAADGIAHNDKIFMEDVTWTNLVEVQMNRRLPFSLNFLDTYLAQPRAPMSNENADLKAGEAYREVVFEHFDHVGVDPPAFERILKTEVENGYGIFLGWFFHFRDWWYASSDNRMLQKSRILRALPELVSAYEDYLARPKPPTGGRCWLLTRTPPEAMSSLERARNVPIGTGRGAADGSLAVNLYRQDDCP